MKSFVVEILIQPNRLVSTYITFQCKESNFSSHHNILFLVEWFDSFFGLIFLCSWGFNMFFLEILPYSKKIKAEYKDIFACVTRKKFYSSRTPLLFLETKRKSKVRNKKTKKFCSRNVIRQSEYRVFQYIFIARFGLNCMIIEWSDPQKKIKKDEVPIESLGLWISFFCF